MEYRLVALVWRLCALICACIHHSEGFRHHGDLKQGFTAIETIVKRGVERLCDAQAAEVLSRSKRPLARLAGDACAGDINTKVAHNISKLVHIPVAEAAARLRDEIRKETDAVQDCFVTGNHYVNIVLKDGFMRDMLREMATDGTRLNVSKMSKETIVIDYFSPNVGKELHMGHLRSAAIGAAMANILEFCGARVIRRNHIGDFGAQSGQIMRYLMEYDPTSIEAFTESETDKERAKETTRLYMDYSLWNLKGISTSNRFSRPTPATSAELIINSMGEIYKNAKKLCESNPEFLRRTKEETALLQRGKHMYQETWKCISKTSILSYRDILEDFRLDKIRDIPESCYAKRVFALVDRLVQRGHAVKQPDGSVTILLTEPLNVLCTSGLDGDDCDAGTSTNLHTTDANSTYNLDNTTDVNNTTNLDNTTDVNSTYNLDNTTTPCDNQHELVLITKEGAATYLAVDLTALEYRLSEHKADGIMYVTDLAQKAHFDKVAAIAKQVGILNDQRIEHLGFGAVMAADGKKMRSRTKSGVSVYDIWDDTLSKCAKEVEKRGEYIGEASEYVARKLAAGSILYADLSTTHGDTYTFSTDRLLNQGGNNLISILYSYVRSRSILRKMDSDGTKITGRDRCLTRDTPFRNDAARKLGLQMVGLENAILAAAILRAPHRLCKYMWALAREFTQFYESTRVVSNGKADAELVQLVALFSAVTKLVLQLLNIETMEFL
ncbi:arginyl-tRNA synthetase [Babesia ovis]|uniref:arginine--tRNA ligase n=1 Tax=Babesia ovis TaxID=5869 RepID=A0A9W5TCH6_BABOV|nr:arginyl-tRNA synthetase [Babesia ovis]